MAQDVLYSDKMAEDQWLLKEDGYLNADTDLNRIVYHPSLNVILICTKTGVVRVLDVNSGVVLQSSRLTGKKSVRTGRNPTSDRFAFVLGENQSEVTCRYVPGQDRILFCDGQAIGVRSDYNGVLLLDSILQKPVTSTKDEVKLELLLSEVRSIQNQRKAFKTVVGCFSGDYFEAEPVFCGYNEVRCGLESHHRKSERGTAVLEEGDQGTEGECAMLLVESCVFLTVL